MGKTDEGIKIKCILAWLVRSSLILVKDYSYVSIVDDDSEEELI